VATLNCVAGRDRALASTARGTSGLPSRDDGVPVGGAHAIPESGVGNNFDAPFEQAQQDQHSGMKRRTVQFVAKKQRVRVYLDFDMAPRRPQEEPGKRRNQHGSQ
jgi:hypothetical protein